MKDRSLNWHFLAGKSSLTDGEYSSLVLHALTQLAKTAKSKLQSTDIEEPFFELRGQRAFYADQLKALKDSIQRFRYDHNIHPDDEDEEKEEDELFADIENIRDRIYSQ